MFQSTTAENFESWDKFLSCYYEPIRAALRLIPFVGEERADDVAQSFFLKMYQRDFLENRPVITGRFRNWLYVAARRHAIDEWRKSRRIERPDDLAAHEPADPRPQAAEGTRPDADELYALSLLHMTVQRVRKHLIEQGKAEHWAIFEEVVLAPMFPGRVAKTREELLASFPGQGPDFLDNRLTTVKRVFRRILPALLPADPTDGLTPEERFRELLDILHASKNSRLWLAFLKDPVPGPDLSPESSLDLASPLPAYLRSEPAVAADDASDELRVLLAFWLDMPLHEFLNDLETVRPAVAGAIRQSYDPGPPAARRRPGGQLNLSMLISRTDCTIPPEEMKVLLERLKSFAKRVYRSHRQAGPAGTALDSRRASSMPPEIAQLLYDLAGALALRHCGTRIIGLSDDRFRKNISWALSQRWLDPRLRPAFAEALRELDVRCG
jgi:hypothetical protein